MVEEGTALVDLAVVVVGRADDHVIVPVAVHVARARNDPTEVGLLLIALRGPDGPRGESSGRSEIDKRQPFVRLVVIVGWSADDHVAVAIAVHVAGGRHRKTEVGVILAALRRPTRRGGEARVRAPIDECPPLVPLASIEVGCANDHVVGAIAIHIAGGRHRGAEIGIGLIRLRHPYRLGRETGRGAVVDEGRTFVRVPGVEVRRPDDHIAESVAVQVTGGGHRRSEIAVGLAALRSPRGGGRDTRWRPEMERGQSLVGLAVVVVGGADDHVVVAIAIHVARV